jgi:NTE family protein
MKTGREIWITRGPILNAARASCAIPGVFTPVKYGNHWMLDGGLVNPVPVSAARALGADVVIAVNLNAQLVGAHMSEISLNAARAEAEALEDAKNRRRERSIWMRLGSYLESREGSRPGFFDVLAASANIMQDRITRSRMAGDPAEITLIPRLQDFALLDFHRAGEAIEEGRRLIEAAATEIRAWAHL